MIVPETTAILQSTFISKIWIGACVTPLWWTPCLKSFDLVHVKRVLMQMAPCWHYRREEKEQQEMSKECVTTREEWVKRFLQISFVEIPTRGNALWHKIAKTAIVQWYRSWYEACRDSLSQFQTSICNTIVPRSACVPNLSYLDCCALQLL